jgi:hypothetical protein
MKLKVKIYRTVLVRVSELLSQAGIDYNNADIPMAEVTRRFRSEMGPLHPLLEVFWPRAETLGEALNYRAQAGMEALTFDVLDVKIEGGLATPLQGMVHTDPMDPTAVAHLDGALEGELNRIGVSTNFEGYEWRCTYKVEGN